MIVFVCPECHTRMPQPEPVIIRPFGDYSGQWQDFSIREVPMPPYRTCVRCRWTVSGDRP